MERVIFHCDLNSFYASVELLDHPELREQPVAVCGDPASRKGVILAKNEEAKAKGVKTAETIWQARRKCPQLVLLPAHFGTYRYYSRLANEIYERYTDLVEPFGIDESWLDLTGSLHLFGGNAKETADEIRSVLRGELGLTASVGVSFNKIFAKLGSDYQKPDATTLITRENYRELLWPLPARDMLFVGSRTAEILSRGGIRTIGDIARASEQYLFKLLGKQGVSLYSYANGAAGSSVRPAAEPEQPKSVGNGRTFEEDIQGWEEIRSGVAMLSERVGERLRRQGLKGNVIQVSLRTPTFQEKSRQKKLPQPTNLAREITEISMGLVEEIWLPQHPLRAIRITASALVEAAEAGHQLSLFAPEEMLRHRKQERLEETMDQLREKYGREIVQFADHMDQSGKESE